ncbi:MAG: hypothetical protein IJV39_02880 [Ruminococcus sp.]|nr:hypothetical protein [Ruminococcus sp.]
MVIHIQLGHNAYIIDKRLEKASAMLAEGERNVTQIAAMVGYKLFKIKNA